MPNFKWNNIKEIFTSKDGKKEDASKDEEGDSDGEKDKQKGSDSKGGAAGAIAGAIGILAGAHFNRNANRRVLARQVVLYPPDFDDLVSCWDMMPCVCVCILFALSEAGVSEI